MTTTRGGKREGSGRKRGLASIKAEESRKYVVGRIAEELEPILSGQIDLAKGIYREIPDGERKTKIYQQLPDSKVAEYLLNQAIGRPKEIAEVKMESTHIIDPEKTRKIRQILGLET